MKCPYCKYVSFEYLTSCKKCSKDLTAHKHQHGIDFVQPKPLGILAFLQASSSAGESAFEDLNFDSDAITLDSHSSEDGNALGVTDKHDTMASLDLTNDAPVSLTDSSESTFIINEDDEVEVSEELLSEPAEELDVKEITRDDEQALDESGFSLQVEDNQVSDVSSPEEVEEEVFADSGFSLQLGNENELGFDSSEGSESFSSGEADFSDSLAEASDEPLEITIEDPSEDDNDIISNQLLSLSEPDEVESLELSEPREDNQIPELPDDSNEWILEDAEAANNEEPDDSIGFELLEEDESAGMELEESVGPKDNENLSEEDFSEVDFSLDEKELFGDELISGDDEPLEDLDIELDSDSKDK